MNAPPPPTKTSGSMAQVYRTMPPGILYLALRAQFPLAWTRWRAAEAANARLYDVARLLRNRGKRSAEIIATLSLDKFPAVLEALDTIEDAQTREETALLREQRLRLLERYVALLVDGWRGQEAQRQVQWLRQSPRPWALATLANVQRQLASPLQAFAALAVAYMDPDDDQDDLDVETRRSVQRWMKMRGRRGQPAWRVRRFRTV